MIRVLMIGSFLSKRSGTTSVSENLGRLLKSPELEFTFKSKQQSKVLRLLGIIVSSLFSRFDVIHIDTFSGQAFRIAEIASGIAKCRKKRIIITLHGGMLPEFYSKFPLRVSKVIARANLVQTPSLYLQSFFNHNNIELDYLPNSIDLALFPYDRSNVMPHSILWVRAFSDIYNPHIPVLVLSELQKLYPDVRLTMIGPDKGLLGEIQGMIRELNLESSVNITGPVQNEKLFRYYQTHAVFLNTTQFESFGVAVLEAAACGVPIVSSRVGEIPFLYAHEKEILTVDGFEPSIYAKEIVKIFESTPLTPLAENLSRNARRVAEGFAWEKIKDKWIRKLSTDERVQ